jgi:hypothetical protein
MQVPEWFLALQTILVPVMTIICGAALKVLWGMRQELTTLNVKMELTTELRHEIDQLWNLIRKLEKAIGANE